MSSLCQSKKLIFYCCFFNYLNLLVIIFHNTVFEKYFKTAVAARNYIELNILEVPIMYRKNIDYMLELLENSVTERLDS